MLGKVSVGIVPMDSLPKTAMSIATTTKVVARLRAEPDDPHALSPSTHRRVEVGFQHAALATSLPCHLPFSSRP